MTRIVLSIVAVAYLAFGVVYDRYVIAEENCPSSEAAVCLTTLFYLEYRPLHGFNP